MWTLDPSAASPGGGGGVMRIMGPSAASPGGGG